MKTTITTIAMLLCLNLTYGQSPLPVGRNQVNFGVGLSTYGVPLYLGIDHSVGRDVTIGAEVSYRSYNEKFKDLSYRHSITGISGNFNYHFNSVFKIPQTWDLYAGLNLGFYVWTSPDGYTGTHSSGLGVGAQVGGRYYFSKKTAINLEFGGGNAFNGGKFGLSIKL